MSDNIYAVAIEEAGHHVVAEHYRVASFPELTPDGISILDPNSTPHSAGVCHLDEPVSKFEHAAICWAGIISLCLFGVAPTWAPPFKLTKRMLRDWCSMIFQQRHRLSDADQRGIISYADTLRACKSAFAIVTKNRARIVRLAKALAESKTKSIREADEKKWAGVPRPASFPASHADFIRLVCGGSAERFEKFITSKALSILDEGAANLEAAKKSMADKKTFLGQVADEARAKHPGKSDAEIADILFDENFAGIVKGQRDNYANFASPDSWLAAARHFQQWASEENLK
jgi:hypothetical protein